MLSCEDTPDLGRGPARVETDEPVVERPEPKQSEQLHELLREAHALGERLDERLRGRLLWALSAGAAGSAVSATLLTLQRRATAAALLELATGACLLWLGFAWLGTCRDAGGAHESAGILRRLQAELRLFARDLGSWLRSPKLLKLLVVSRACAALGFTALALASLWNSYRACAGGAASPRLLGLQLLGSAALGLAQLSSWARRAHRPHDTAPLDQCQQAAREFPAVIDLSQPLELDTLFIEPTLLHQVVDALARWQVSDRWPSTHAYTVALQRHLQYCLPEHRVERDRWLGGTRAAGVAALVVDDTVLIEVQRGFSGRRADAALARVRACSRNGQGKPIILVVFDAASGDLLRGNVNGSLESLHEQNAFVAACMPGARREGSEGRGSDGVTSRPPSSIPPALG